MFDFDEIESKEAFMVDVGVGKVMFDEIESKEALMVDVGVERPMKRILELEMDPGIDTDKIVEAIQVCMGKGIINVQKIEVPPEVAVVDAFTQTDEIHAFAQADAGTQTSSLRGKAALTIIEGRDSMHSCTRLVGPNDSVRFRKLSDCSFGR